jgi:hypothetical protein
MGWHGPRVSQLLAAGGFGPGPGPGPADLSYSAVIYFSRALQWPLVLSAFLRYPRSWQLARTQTDSAGRLCSMQ